jgi:long-subunit fatty acid transport protein
MKILPVALLFGALPAAAWAQDQQVGARTKAMGGSYTAFEDDPVSIWLNPSGIATQTDAVAVAYQTYTIYEFEVRSAGSPKQGQPEYAWTDPAIIPSFAGVTFQLGEAESPQAIGFCFTTPFRLKFVYDADPTDGVYEGDGLIDQVFYRIRAAYAYDWRFRPPGSEGFLTHLAFGLGLDINVTNWTVTEFKDSVDSMGNPVESTFSVSGTDMGFGGGAGLLLGVYDNTRNFKVNFGAAYQSKANYEFSVDVPFVPLSDWPNQYQVGLTFYLFEGFPLRLTADAQLIEWNEATRNSEISGLDDFEDAFNYSLGVEYRVNLSGKVRLYPRVGLRRYQAPWNDEDDLPAIGFAQLFIDPRDDTFLIYSAGAGVGWSSEEGKQRSFDLAVDYGGDAPGVAASFSLEF